MSIILGKYKYITKVTIETLLQASREIGLNVNREKKVHC
jgi:hypothetical protein